MGTPVAFSRWPVHPLFTAMTPLNIHGILNGYNVDGLVWRGAQPDHFGLAAGSRRGREGGARPEHPRPLEQRRTSAKKQHSGLNKRTLSGNGLPRARVLGARSVPPLVLHSSSDASRIHRRVSDGCPEVFQPVLSPNANLIRASRGPGRPCSSAGMPFCQCYWWEIYGDPTPADTETTVVSL
jgi:hypothetical protein